MSIGMDGAKPKVALINPSWETRHWNPGALPDLYPPLGLGCVAAVLRADAFPVEIIDMPILRMPDEDLIRQLRQAPPGIIGLTAVTLTYPRVVQLARLIRRELPGIPILVGGVHVTLRPDEVLQEDCFDFSVAGEGELAALELCRGVARGRVAPDLSGVGYHQVPRPYRQPAMDVDIRELPPHAYDLFDMGKYRRIFKRMAILTSRGCNGRCIFCATGYAWPRVKFMPLARVMTELRYLVKDVGFRYINIFDSSFTAHKGRVHALCDQIIAGGLKFRWRCFSRAQGVDLGLFRKMRAAGCSHVLFGVETSHLRTLKLIKKGTSPQQTVAAFRLAQEAGLKRVAYAIIGLPGEDRQDILDSLDFLEKLEADYHVVSPISLMPGTPLHDHRDEYRMILWEDDYAQGSQGQATASNSLLSLADIQELADYAYRRLNRGREGYNWIDDQ